MAVGVGYYLGLTLGSCRFDPGLFSVDSYRIFGLASALLCAVAGYVAWAARGGSGFVAGKGGFYASSKNVENLLFQLLLCHLFRPEGEILG